MADIHWAALLHFPPRARRSRHHHGGPSGELEFGVVRQSHEAALAALFGDMLQLCGDAGVVGVAVLATDRTNVHVNVSQHQNLD